MSMVESVSKDTVEEKEQEAPQQLTNTDPVTAAVTIPVTTDNTESHQADYDGFDDESDDVLLSEPVVSTIRSSQRRLVKNSTTTVPNVPLVSTFVDHFTLPVQSSTVRYRDSRAAARVIDGLDAQYVLEETYEKRRTDPRCSQDEHADDDDDDNRNYETTSRIELRRIPDSNSAVLFLRVTYVMVTAFWTGFLFIFCLHLLLFLALDLSIQLGITSKAAFHVGRAIGSLLAFGPLIYALGSGLVLAGAFIMDTWRGHALIQNFAFRNFGPVAVEWIFFVFFLGAPMLIMCFALLSGTDDWWKITMLVWFSCIAFFYALFVVNVIVYELLATFLVVRNHYHCHKEKWHSVLCRIIYARQLRTYSGTKRISVIAKGTIEDLEYTDKSVQNKVDETMTTYVSYLTKLTQWEKLSTRYSRYGIYHPLEGTEEERIYSIDDVRDVRPFLTSNTWGLEKVFCRARNSRYIAIVDGPGALTKSQLRSSLVCSFVGIFLIFFLVFSVLVYLNMGIAATLFGLVMGGIYFYPRILSTLAIYKVTKVIADAVEEADLEEATAAAAAKIEQQETGTTTAITPPPPDMNHIPEESEGIYLIEELFRCTKPTPLFCGIMFIVECFVFFIYPVASLFGGSNWPLGFLFFLFVFTTGLRYYIDATVILADAGHLDLVGGRSMSARWKKQTRLNEIIGNVSHSNAIGGWISVLSFTALAFVALMFGAIGTGTESLTGLPNRAFLGDFRYDQTDSLRYPTCQLSSELGESPLIKMADYAFLAGLAYYDENKTQVELDAWFGNGTAIDEVDIVANYRKQKKVSSAVSFKLVTFPTQTDPNRSFAYILIRGTITAWDLLTDAQLWSAAGLMQILREILPLGAMWTPVIDQLIRVINTVESESINRVSFYKDTGAFAQFLLENTGEGSGKLYSGVAVTGHSLGGGLSLITGAQNAIPAVALSGPNTVLSRKSFDPPIKREDLDKHTFNIIPERDIVPMLDDRAQNYQTIRCQAEFTDIVGCHDSLRSLCEIIYTCGSFERPIPCKCVTDFGYPSPRPKMGVNITFEEACAAVEPLYENHNIPQISSAVNAQNKIGFLVPVAETADPIAWNNQTRLKSIMNWIGSDRIRKDTNNNHK